MENLLDKLAEGIALARLQTSVCGGQKTGGAKVAAARDAARVFAVDQCARNVAHALKDAGALTDTADFLAKCQMGR